jgi:hypothetical protein
MSDLVCFVCAAPASVSLTQGDSLVPVCKPCLARALANAYPACPTCGFTLKRSGRPSAYSDDQHLLAALRAIPPDAPAPAWRALVKASGLNTHRAMAARDRLLASGQIELFATGRDGAQLYRIRPAAPQ